jgi:acetyltransferase-like isoleucine patch superfamily enzyme
VDIHPTAIVEPGVTIGEGTKIWDHVHVRTGAVIGASCILGEKTYIAYGVRIGNLVKINANVYIPTGVTIGDGVMIAAHVVFTNDRHPRATDRDILQAITSAPTDDTLPTVVERGATIGSNSTIGPGLRLGAWCMVGMGSVVTADVPPFGLVVGNPARIVGLVARDGRTVWRGPREGGLPRHAIVALPGDGRLVVDNGTVRHEM